MAELKGAKESISVSGNRVRSLTKEELEALTSDLQAVLEKHSAEMGVTSTINLMKVVDESELISEEITEEATPEADSETEKGS